MELNKTLFGVVAAAVANFGPNPLNKPLTAADFVGASSREKPDDSRPSQKSDMARTRAFLMSITTNTQPN